MQKEYFLTNLNCDSSVSVFCQNIDIFDNANLIVKIIPLEKATEITEILLNPNLNQLVAS